MIHTEKLRRNGEEEWKALVHQTNNAKEIMGEHILDSVYIAMFFLPLKWGVKKSEYSGNYRRTFDERPCAYVSDDTTKDKHFSIHGISERKIRSDDF